MIEKMISLIPRYNWDYHLPDLIKAFAGILVGKSDAGEALERVFGQRPIFTASGRTSLYVILKSLNLPEGSNVGVPLFCCPVVFEAIRQAKLTPSFVDINLDDYNLSASDLARKAKSLSAIVVVHMFGFPADMDAISRTCADMPIIEDCAQSLFSTCQGEYTGFQSTASFFSFRSGKYISAGEGSAIFCSDRPLRESMKRLVETFAERSLSQELVHCTATYIKSAFYHRPWYGTLGYPLGRLLDKRLNLTSKTGFSLMKIYRGDLHILNERIGSFINKVNRQRGNALYFRRKINTENVILPAEREGCLSNYYQFPVRFHTSEQRDFAADYLRKRGIDSAKYLSDLVDIVKEAYDYEGDCPNAELCARTTLIIPHYYSLSPRDLDYVGDALNEATHSLRSIKKD
jgi:dTDP-4-amino-4,6-dideoxygalactose transaminase